MEKWVKVLNQLRVTGEGTIVSELLGDRFLNYYSFMHMDVVIQTRSKTIICDGYYYSYLGDLALATALNANLLIFTSSSKMYITPESEVTVGTVFVVYDPTGTGHYDAALPFNNKNVEHLFIAAVE